jgi:hypothetical protein
MAKNTRAALVLVEHIARRDPSAPELAATQAAARRIYRRSRREAVITLASLA